MPCTLELLDNFTINAVEGFAHVGLPTDAQALLLIEVDGYAGQVEEEAQKITKLCENKIQVFLYPKRRRVQPLPECRACLIRWNERVYF